MKLLVDVVEMLHFSAHQMDTLLNAGPAPVECLLTYLYLFVADRHHIPKPCVSVMLPILDLIQRRLMSRAANHAAGAHGPLAPKTGIRAPVAEGKNTYS